MEDMARRGTRSECWVLCTAETSGEGAGTISFCIRGDSSHRSRFIGVEGRLQAARGGEKGGLIR